MKIWLDWSHRDIHRWEAVPYDWRLAPDQVLSSGKLIGGNKISYLLATSSPYIIQELKNLARDSKTGKVTIVAHSNGGLVVKRLTEILGPDAATLIDKIILVASPQAGTPQAIGAMLHGDNQGLPFDAFPYKFSNKAARSLSLNMPMAYNLLPSPSYFTYVDDPVITIDNTLPEWQAKYGNKIHSTEQLRNFLTDASRTKPAYDDLTIPEIGNPTLFDQATILHDIQLDHWVPPPGVQLIQIAGWGIPTTMKGVDYSTGQKCVRIDSIVIQGRTSYYCGQYTPVLTSNASTTIDGDGTVTVPSALWTGTGTGVKNYWVDLARYNNKHPVSTVAGFAPFKHANILEVSELRTFLTDILTSSIKPLAQYTYLSTESPPSSENRLRYTLHSPLSLNLYDNEGHHTGISTTTGEVDQQISGTYYTEFGDVKYIFTDASTTSHIVMSGYATGTFTFNIDELRGDALIASTTFKDVATTPNTKVTLDVQSDIATVSSMQVDQNNDGITDISLAPKLGGTVTLPLPDLTTPTTSATTTGTLGKSGWYTSNVLVTLTATDTGSGVASTTYSLNNGATWITYATPVSVSTEGTTTLLYRSKDKAGNIESAHTLTLKIDKTAPEAQVSVSTSTQDILVEGTDNLGTTTISKDTAGNYTVADQAGHTTKLFFTKTYSGKQLTFAQLTAIQYDAAPKTSVATSSFLYIWDTKVTPPTLVSQTIAVNDTFLITALYDKKANKTTVVILKKKVSYQATSFTGLKIIKLMTTKGTIGYTL